jgi:hypothetical protein
MEETNKPNPNGANGSTSDPREQVCWDYYVETITSGMPNAYASAIKAGYEESSAKQITVRRWFIERLEDLERKDMLSKAEKKLAKTLTYEVENDKGEVKTDLLRIQVDVSKHLTETLGKNKGYSKKTETDLTTLGKSINWNEEKTYLNEAQHKTNTSS